MNFLHLLIAAVSSHQLLFKSELEENFKVDDSVLSALLSLNKIVILDGFHLKSFDFTATSIQHENSNFFNFNKKINVEFGFSIHLVWMIYPLVYVFSLLYLKIGYLQKKWKWNFIRYLVDKIY